MLECKYENILMYVQQYVHVRRTQQMIWCVYYINPVTMIIGMNPPPAAAILLLLLRVSLCCCRGPIFADAIPPPPSLPPSCPALLALLRCCAAAVRILFVHDGISAFSIIHDTHQTIPAFHCVFHTRAAPALPAVTGWYRRRERSFAPWSQAFGEPATVSLA